MAWRFYTPTVLKYKFQVFVLHLSLFSSWHFLLLLHYIWDACILTAHSSFINTSLCVGNGYVSVIHLAPDVLCLAVCDLPSRAKMRWNAMRARLMFLTWLGTAEATRRTSLRLSSLLIKSVSQMDNTENGESAASARNVTEELSATPDPPLPWRKSPRLSLPWTLNESL